MLTPVPDSSLFADSSDPYRVRVEAFEGPLDLLLHLIRKNELDIYDIPIAEVTRQYMQYLAMMKELNLDVAGEFLVMATTLLQIKSRLLLPFHPEEEEEEGGQDPRLELVQRLVDYERYRRAAEELQERPLVGRDVFLHPPLPEQQEPHPDILVATDLGIFDLVAAFERILASLPTDMVHEVHGDSYRVSDRMTDILDLLQQHGLLTLQELCGGMISRDYLVATFLAILELCRMRMVRIGQDRLHGSIRLTPAVAADDSADDSPCGEGMI
jgi:segregation and condensation protein A